MVQWDRPGRSNLNTVAFVNFDLIGRYTEEGGRGQQAGGRVVVAFLVHYQRLMSQSAIFVRTIAVESEQRFVNKQSVGRQEHFAYQQT